MLASVYEPRNIKSSSVMYPIFKLCTSKKTEVRKSICKTSAGTSSYEEPRSSVGSNSPSSLQTNTPSVEDNSQHEGNPTWSNPGMEAQPLAYQIHKRKAKKWYANASMPEGKITKPLDSHPRWRVGQLTPALRPKSQVLGR